MSEGRLIAVVGPSGVGKDSVMAGLKAAMPNVKLVRRAITRAPDLGGEDYDAMTPDMFNTAVQDGAFCVHWAAHGLQYGIPIQVQKDVAGGAFCLANFSRSALLAGAEVFPKLIVLNVTARAETLAARLTKRAREKPDAIAKRLAQARKPLPAGLTVAEVSNDGPLEQTIAAAVAALQPRRG